jgi:hypothetical protein
MNTAALLALADHLESGVRRHQVFDFRYVSIRPRGIHKKLNDPARGCGLGELPKLFPKVFGWKNLGTTYASVGPFVREFSAYTIRLKSNSDFEALHAAAVFFDIPYTDSMDLFWFGRNGKPTDAESMACDIRQYVKGKK